MAPLAIGMLGYTDFVEVMNGEPGHPAGQGTGERGLACAA
jgi:hypothetical protein